MCNLILCHKRPDLSHLFSNRAISKAGVILSSLYLPYELFNKVRNYFTSYAIKLLNVHESAGCTPGFMLCYELMYIVLYGGF